jgi:hypothetical protein
MLGSGGAGHRSKGHCTPALRPCGGLNVSARWRKIKLKTRHKLAVPPYHSPAPQHTADALVRPHDAKPSIQQHPERRQSPCSADLERNYRVNCHATITCSCEQRRSSAASPPPDRTLSQLVIRKERGSGFKHRSISPPPVRSVPTTRGNSRARSSSALPASADACTGNLARNISGSE